eukprot:Partr_v1_DN28738_c2_g1_i2_m62156 putative kinesin-like protein
MPPAKPAASKLKPPASVSNALRKDDCPVQKTGLKRAAAVTCPTSTSTTSSAVSKVRKTATTHSSAVATRPKANAVSRTTSTAETKKENSSATSNAVKKRPAWDLKGRLEDMEGDQLEMKHHIKASNDTVADLVQKLDANAVERNELVAMRKDLEQLLDSKTNEITEKTAAIDELNRKIESIRAENESKLESFVGTRDAEIRDLTLKLADLQAAHDQLQQKYQSGCLELEAVKASLASSTSTFYQLEAKTSMLKLDLEKSETDSKSKADIIGKLKQELEESRLACTDMEEKLREAESMRRRLHNTIQELKGNIRVFCRVRPPLGSELLAGKSEEEILSHLSFPDKDSKEIRLTIDSVSANGMNTVGRNYEFSFDKVFMPSSSQAMVFEEISQLVQSACDGYNVCIFAYGQTGSGKTFTMEGPSSSLDNDEQMGMIPRGVLQIWHHTEQLKAKGWTYSMEGSFVEIYNETIRDLLSTSSEPKKCEVKHLEGGKTIITETETVILTSPQQVISILKRAAQNRKVASTECNERSSRSHSVFILKISGENQLTGESCSGVLNLIDLAGSERLANSGSTGDRLKETQAINKSLSCLGDVISALGNSTSHVPYRNSKLTYLLQNSLGGNSKTLMFVNVAPSVDNFNETLCSLRFATKVNNCQIGTARKLSSK